MWIMTAEGWKMLQPKQFIQAPAKGIYRPNPERAVLTRRVEDYALAVQRYAAGEIGIERVYDGWAKPLAGAFGEDLK